MFRTCGVAAVGSASDLQATIANLKKLDVLDSPEAQELVELASTQAQIDLEQRIDERQTFRNDPLRRELQRQAERYQLPSEVQLTRTREAVADLGHDITARALAWSEVEQQRLRILRAEFQGLQPIVEQARLAVQIREQELTAYKSMVTAWHAYSSQVALVLDAAAGTVNDAPVVGGALTKSCDGPSGSNEIIQLEGPDRIGLKVLIAEVSYDKGGKQTTHFRRLSHSTRWIGRIDWPPAH